jgi:hypothetical protein
MSAAQGAEAAWIEHRPTRRHIAYLGGILPEQGPTSRLASTEGLTGLNHSLDDCLGVPNSRDIAVHDGLVAEGY